MNSSKSHEASLDEKYKTYTLKIVAFLITSLIFPLLIYNITSEIVLIYQFKTNDNIVLQKGVVTNKYEVHSSNGTVTGYDIEYYDREGVKHYLRNRGSYTGDNRWNIGDTVNVFYPIGRLNDARIESKFENEISILIQLFFTTIFGVIWFKLGYFFLKKYLARKSN